MKTQPRQHISNKYNACTVVTSPVCIGSKICRNSVAYQERGVVYVSLTLVLQIITNKIQTFNQFVTEFLDSVGFYYLTDFSCRIQLGLVKFSM